MKFKFLAVLVLALIFCVASSAMAMTEQERHVLINQIQQQITSLTQQVTQMLAQQQGSQIWCHDFNTNLGFAQSGTSEIASLHVALQLEEISYNPDGINTYGWGTEGAVRRFQTNYSIYPYSGWTGPLTRNKLNQLYGCTAVAPVPTPSATCTPNWYVGAWSACVNGYQTRTVADYNNCGIIIGAPATSQSCSSFYTPTPTPSPGFVPTPIPGCTPDWQAGEWSACVNARQSRTITDVNNCGITTDAPVTAQSCVSAAITLLSPNGGKQFSARSDIIISWTATRWTSSGSSYTPGNIKIDLYKGGSLVMNIIPYTISISSNSYSWGIPVLAPGSDYKIRVSLYGAEDIYDESDAPFSIVGAITVTSPNGGEVLGAGSTVQITWSAPGRTGLNRMPTIPYVKIDLYKGGRLLFQLTPSVPNSGEISSSYTWTVPASYYEDYIDNFYSNDYKIRISKVGDPSFYDESDAGFSIAGFSHAITVTSPNGGETLTAGRTYRFTWTTSGSVDATNVKIEIYRGGVSVDRVTLDAPNTGGYVGVPKSSLLAGNDYKVRISNVGDTSIYDESDANFSINVIPQSITVTSPNGGEQIAVTPDSTYTIRWGTTGSERITDVKIDLYKGGVFQQTIVTSASSYLGSGGSYNWRPWGIVAGNDYKIRISNAAYGHRPQDESDANFSIINP